MRLPALLCLLLLTVSLTLTSCASGTTRTPHDLEPLPVPNLVIPPPLLAECPPLPLVDDGGLPALLSNHVDVARMYAECRTRHACTVDSIRSQKGVTLNGVPPMLARPDAACDGKGQQPEPTK
jgi:hypothetical protein